MDDINMQKPEVPIIIIERDEQPQSKEIVTKVIAPSKKHKWLKRFLALVAFGCVMVAALAGYYLWNYYYNIGVSVSVTPEQNIEKLQRPAKQEVPEVVMTCDSILGVAMDFYAIHGLKASIEFEEPDTADTSVYLYCRSVDHKADNTYIGSLVVNGEERQSDTHRLGYMAMLGNNFVIGISRSEKVKDYVQEHGGSFFRQFILVSNGEIPGRFFLHGKVERRAIGRIDDQLYFIATRHKETLWDFADALREYGFIDAIYITGGADYVFYRDKDGIRHDIGDSADYPHTKWKCVVPWLVFRK
ncbi:phosphodiester glycosidase family protein [Prevotella sp. E13-27]|uniref:phosphodiester glycosidase family protein n=1 Tax=Prevotella sp. E13-27 TaxID=2938122 RepID=UPI00200A4521|nr:phosphodiester glycosidase family protein [Prevotella sp. E13-27]MCK8621521.1 phosphodiester glycosidase family protein [Prevotella sp. E13-27]